MGQPSAACLGILAAVVLASIAAAGIGEERTSQTRERYGRSLKSFPEADADRDGAPTESEVAQLGRSRMPRSSGEKRPARRPARPKSGKGGAVASHDSCGVEAGLAVLEQGGNAADAAAAAILALSIGDYGAFAIGGDCPILVYDAKARAVKVICGVGGAPRDANSIQWFYDNPLRTAGQASIKHAPVPGAVGGCVKLLELCGTVSFKQAAAYAMGMLDRGGRDWHPALAATFRKLAEAEQKAEPDRAAGLRAVHERFYKGDVAADMAKYFRRNGGFLRKRDFEAFKVRVERPVTASYRGFTVCKCGPWTQGPALLESLRLLEGFDLKGMGHLSADYCHAVVEAMKLAFADRDYHYADPLFADVPLEKLLSDEYATMRRRLIDVKKPSSEIRPGDPVNMKPVVPPRRKGPSPGGTTTCVVADRWGNVVAATPSCNRPYHVDPATGVTHGNRLRSMNALPGHPNRIQPGKRPRITLTPTIVLKDGRAVAAVSVAGGDLQDQRTLSLLLGHTEFGQLPREALRDSRLYTGHLEDSFNPSPDRGRTIKRANIISLPRRAAAAAKELEQRGHRIGSIGRSSAAMLVVDRDTGVIHAAGESAAGALP